MLGLVERLIDFLINVSCGFRPPVPTPMLIDSGVDD
jgi:hypothetical protein